MQEHTIMIVDDNKEFLDELSDTLGSSGYEIIAVNEGTAALAVAGEYNPDLILLDLRMKGKNGFEVADDLRHAPLTRNTPIIAMTGFFTSENLPALMDAHGIRLCLQKPFKVCGLISCIEKLLQENRNRAKQRYF